MYFIKYFCDEKVVKHLKRQIWYPYLGISPEIPLHDFVNWSKSLKYGKNKNVALEPLGERVRRRQIVLRTLVWFI